MIYSVTFTIALIDGENVEHTLNIDTSMDKVPPQVREKIAHLNEDNLLEMQMSQIMQQIAGNGLTKKEGNVLTVIPPHRISEVKSEIPSIGIVMAGDIPQDILLGKSPIPFRRN